MQVTQDAIAISTNWDNPELSVEQQNGAAPAAEHSPAEHQVS